MQMINCWETTNTIEADKAILGIFHLFKKCKSIHDKIRGP